MDSVFIIVSSSENAPFRSECNAHSTSERVEFRYDARPLAVAPVTRRLLGQFVGQFRFGAMGPSL